LIVTPRGDVKPCCGFASDLDQLTIGNIYRDSVETIIQAGRKHPFVGTIFRKGLTAIREQVETLHPGNLPGATSNHCFFCWFVLTRNLTGLDDAPPTDRRPGRRGLPMISDPASPPLENGETLTRVLVFFDGRKVQLAPEPWEVVRAWEGKPYLVGIAGPSQVVLSQAEMTWPDY
ncbi:MAG: SPASM domain-containing protein, partial [Gemmataceae bacterium]